MLRKLTAIFGLLFLSFYILGCSNQVASSTSLTLEQSIKEIIMSKGSGYDFLDDEGYMKHMEKLGEQLVTNTSADPVHYAIGNLDEDTIPELVVFKERDSNDMDDEGSLEVYQFNNNKYILLDTIPMSFDNTNYNIEIGKISENQNGIFLNNQVGAHSGITYGFILKDKKFESILNDNKIPLLSIYPDNEIKDIDGDGILNFSISTVDPESEISNMADSDKMALWYEWNGKDGGELVMVQRKSREQVKSNKKLFEQIGRTMDDDFYETITLLKSSKDDLSKFDNTKLLSNYIKRLYEIIQDKSMEVDNLFIKYQEDNSFDHIFKKYGLTVDKLNSIEYLSREKVLKDEGELKRNIIDNISLGYKLSSSEGSYYYLIDYQSFLDFFSENLTNEYMDYLNILALNTNNPYMKDGSLTISTKDLVERILLVESFKMIYPYSDLLLEINNIYLEYIDSYFYGDLHNPNFHKDTLIIKEETLERYENTIEKYEYTAFANIVKDFMKLLGENKNIVNSEFKEEFEDRLN